MHSQLDVVKLSIVIAAKIEEVVQLLATIQGSGYLKSGYWINSLKITTTTVARKIHHHSMNFEEH